MVREGPRGQPDNLCGRDGVPKHEIRGNIPGTTSLRGGCSHAWEPIEHSLRVAGRADKLTQLFSVRRPLMPGPPNQSPCFGVVLTADHFSGVHPNWPENAMEPWTTWYMHILRTASCSLLPGAVREEKS